MEARRACRAGLTARCAVNPPFGRRGQARGRLHGAMGRRCGPKAGAARCGAGFTVLWDVDAAPKPARRGAGQVSRRAGTSMRPQSRAGAARGRFHGAMGRRCGPKAGAARRGGGFTVLWDVDAAPKPARRGAGQVSRRAGTSMRPQSRAGAARGRLHGAMGRRCGPKAGAARCGGGFTALWDVDAAPKPARRGAGQVSRRHGTSMRPQSRRGAARGRFHGAVGRRSSHNASAGRTWCGFDRVADRDAEAGRRVSWKVRGVTPAMARLYAGPSAHCSRVPGQATLRRPCAKQARLPMFAVRILRFPILPARACRCRSARRNARRPLSRPSGAESCPPYGVPSRSGSVS
jgi:hypothetical protein